MSTRHTKTIKRTYSKTAPIDVLIPSAGIGRRMRSHGPTSLIPIGNDQRILDRQIRDIDNFFKKGYKLVLVCGFEADKLMNSAPNDIIKVENELYEDTNICRSIGIGLRAISKTKRLLILNGDLVFTENTISSMSYDSSCLFVSEESMGENEVGCIINSEGNLENMMYDLPTKWCQISYFQGRELDLLKEISWNRKNKKLFTFEIINKIIEAGGSFRCVANPEAKVVDVDTSKDIKKAKEIII